MAKANWLVDLDFLEVLVLVDELGRLVPADELGKSSELVA